MRKEIYQELFLSVQETADILEISCTMVQKLERCGKLTRITNAPRNKFRSGKGRQPIVFFPREQVINLKRQQ
jgi:hypothetical protein